MRIYSISFDRTVTKSRILVSSLLRLNTRYVKVNLQRIAFTVDSINCTSDLATNSQGIIRNSISVASRGAIADRSLAIPRE